MTTIETTIAGIPCRVRVTRYSPPRAMRITGSGFGDAEPPEPEEFEYEVLDRTGHVAPWLADKVTEADEERLASEYREHLEEWLHGC